MRNKFTFIYIISLLIIFFSCNKDEILTDSNVKLTFSTDTVMFDTVFTTIGSTTKRLKVYNTYDKTINISSVKLAGNTITNFRLNIDGDKVNSVSDLEILPNDSLYIFVEVTVDPNGENSPILIQDSIIFITNGNVQDIDLVAFGQDVHLINGQIIETETWNNDKPYLIYNSMLVDSLKTLTINEGTQLHFHRNSSLIVLGTLIVKGTVENPVVFQGDRLEPMYDDVPGQWGVIALIAGSTNNRIDHAIIKNGIVGIQVGEYNKSVAPDLFITNTRIENMTTHGLYLFNSTVVAANCLIANCGYYGAFMAVSGIHKFYHCTFANYFEYANRVDPTVLISNNISVNVDGVNNQYIGNMDVYFGNSIIYGNNIEEIGISEATEANLNYKFENCLIKDSTFEHEEFPLDLTDESHFVNIINNKNPRFKDINEYNYELDTLSIAKDAGARSITDLFGFLEFDMLGNSRILDSNPDLGAYERVE
ncbi:MAG: hypothetical protein GXO79_12675 [Chlorobi bacterium]|nr:hypothetical protein [Chlorobiota bacterium]